MANDVITVEEVKNVVMSLTSHECEQVINAFCWYVITGEKYNLREDKMKILNAVIEKFYPNGRK